MRYKIIHHRERKWPKPENHLDGRVCPECAVTVHGWTGQRAHDRHHEQQMALMMELAKRTGMTEEELEMPWSWGAEISGTEGEAEAIEQ
jgi:hypothetical protein